MCKKECNKCKGCYSKTPLLSESGYPKIGYPELVSLMVNLNNSARIAPTNGKIKNN